MKIIFQNDSITVYCKGNAAYNAKAIVCEVNAINPIDGKIYRRAAGWISSTMALHDGSKTQRYAYDVAIEAIALYKTEIRAAMIAEGKIINDEIDNAGKGVTNSIAHPTTPGQIAYVRHRMRTNAPTGTFH